MIYRLFLVISFLSTIAFSQDVYPFFSDPNQQLEFEQNRIYILKNLTNDKIKSIAESHNRKVYKEILERK